MSRDLAEHDRGDHRADTVQFGESRARCGDRIRDPLLDRGDLSIDALDIAEMLGSDPATLDSDWITWLDVVEELTGLTSRDAQWCATSSELAEHHMQPAGGLGA